MFRSKCHKKLRNVRKAIDDVDTALHIHNLNKEVSRISQISQSKRYALQIYNLNENELNSSKNLEPFWVHG